MGLTKGIETIVNKRRVFPSCILSKVGHNEHTSTRREYVEIHPGNIICDGAGDWIADRVYNVRGIKQGE